MSELVLHASLGAPRDLLVLLSVDHAPRVIDRRFDLLRLGSRVSLLSGLLGDAERRSDRRPRQAFGSFLGDQPADPRIDVGDEQLEAALCLDEPGEIFGPDEVFGKRRSHVGVFLEGVLDVIHASRLVDSVAICQAALTATPRAENGQTSPR